MIVRKPKVIIGTKHAIEAEIALGPIADCVCVLHEALPGGKVHDKQGTYPRIED